MTDQHFTLFDTVIGICGIEWGPRGINGLQLPMGSERRPEPAFASAMRYCGIGTDRRGAARDRAHRRAARGKPDDLT